MKNGTISSGQMNSLFFYSSLTGLKERPIQNENPVSDDKLKRAKDILEMSKKAYGEVGKWRSIAESNDLKNLAINSLATLKVKM